MTHTAEELLEIVKSTNAPDELKNENGNVGFATPSGCKVTIFYDCGEFDYVDRIEVVDGSVYEYPFSEFQTSDGNILSAYRGP
jgi:hypothetical protein